MAHIWSGKGFDPPADPALLGAALLALARHPLLSRTLLGLLAYKLQFALVIPIALQGSNSGALSPWQRQPLRRGSS
jgi:hypothetical protein